MVKRFIIAILLLGICLAVMEFVLQRISGGRAILNEVISGVKTNTEVARNFGDIRDISKNGAYRVELDLDGNRTGWVSLFAEGSRKSSGIEVRWKKLTTNMVEITEIRIVTNSKDDQLIWPRSISK
jgi:hypothetical protein